MGNIGPLEIGIVLVIILVIFGPKRLPGLGKQLGTTMREFKESVTGDDKDDDEKKPELTQAQAAPAPAPAATTAPPPAAEETERTSTGA